MIEFWNAYSKTACPRQRYGVNTCDNICETCYNGGMCKDDSGICICRPGFMGDHCEIGKFIMIDNEYPSNDL